MTPALSPRSTPKSISKQRFATWVLPLLAVLWLAVLFGAPLLGSTALSLRSVFDSDPTATAIFWQLRLPRVLLGLLAGGALALAGLSFQTVFRNPLAEPYTLGVAGGAALGASLALRWGEGRGLLGLSIIALASFAGALAATGLVLALAARRADDSGTLLLAGVGVSLSTSAVILFLQYLSDATQTFRMVRWMMGGLSVVGYREVLWLAPWTLAGLVVILAARWDLDLLLAGDEIAASRGVDVPRLRLRLLLAVSLMIGALVAVAGPIGFVGLVVPHLLRRAVGARHLALAPACALGGGAFLALADLGARTVLAPAELPVGVLTALFGGPFFLAVLAFGRRR